MTSSRQKKAVTFCEKVLKVRYEGDINDRPSVSNFLNKYLENAKQQLIELQYAYKAYVNDLY